MRVFETLKLGRERELESLVTRNPDQIEEGLVFLDHQLKAASKFIDVLCVDRNGILVVLELKIGEDEGILTQALEYYDYVASNKDRLASMYDSRATINREEEPRIILVASSFSDRVRKAARYVDPELKLVEYEFLRSKGGEKGLHCREVPFGEEGFFRPPVPVTEPVSFISAQKLRELCNQVIDAIQRIGNDIEVRGAGKRQIRFRVKSRRLADVYTRRSFFWIQYFQGGRELWKKIERKNDWNKVRNKVLKIVSKTYTQRGGELEETQ